MIVAIILTLGIGFAAILLNIDSNIAEAAKEASLRTSCTCKKGKKK